MTRPVTEPQDRNRVSTQIRFSKDLHERLTIASNERDLSVSFLVNRAVADFLDRLIPIGEIKWTKD